MSRCEIVMVHCQPPWTGLTIKIEVQVEEERGFDELLLEVANAFETYAEGQFAFSGTWNLPPREANEKPDATEQPK